MSYHGYRGTNGHRTREDDEGYAPRRRSYTPARQAGPVSMTARYAGICAATGKRFQAGARIQYDYTTKKAVLLDDQRALGMENELGANTEDSSVNLAARTRSAGYVSNVFGIGGREYYRNKQGLCEDAPCCGCCTI